MIAPDELVIDCFAGGGGASEGVEEALGRPVDIAINHDADAIEMHKANHPNTLHLTEDVWKQAPHKVTKGKKVGLAWFSPDCKGFSRAKGGKPVEKGIRSLAWVIIRWAASRKSKPRIIVMENVREFADWGPLLPQQHCQGCGWKGTEGQTLLARANGKRRCPRCESVNVRVTEELIPDPNKKGLTFKNFVGRLKGLGYHVEWRNLNAADYGAPTHRRRLFLVARRDKEPIVWPEPTHGDPNKELAGSLFGAPLKPWRTAAECIDWSIPMCSIFATPAEAKAWAAEINRLPIYNRPLAAGPEDVLNGQPYRDKIGTPKRPLAPKTMARIKAGILRYVINNPKPFIVQLAHGEGKDGRWGSGSADIDSPLGTVHSGGKNHALVSPHIVKVNHGGKDFRGQEITEPIGTITHKHGHAVVTPIVVGVGGRAGCTPPTAGDAPLGTITAKNDRVVVAPILTRLGQTGGNGEYVNDPKTPLTTITSKQEHIVASAVLVGTGGPEYAAKPAPVDAPAGTIMTESRKAVCAAFLAKHYGGVVGTPIDEPTGTVTAVDHHSVVAATLLDMHGSNKGKGTPTEPLIAVTAQGNHSALVYSFLTKSYSSGGQWQMPDEPLHTITAKDRLSVITVMVDGEPYIIVDICMRMLTPRELARAQGFRPDYILTGAKDSQVARIGNSVSPPPARALIEANCCEVLEPC